MIPEIDGIEPAARTLRQALCLEITFEQLRSEASAAFPDVVSPARAAKCDDDPAGSLTEALRSPGNIGSIVDDAMDSLLTGPDAVFSEEDREEVVATLEQRLGLEPEQTDQIVQSLEARFEGAVEEVTQTVDQFQQQALEVAQQFLRCWRPRPCD